MIKTVSAWAAGNNAGGLETGSIAASTWYHVYAILNPGTGAVDYLFSTNAAAPTAFPSGFTQARRIGSFKTDGSNAIIPYKQFGDEFLWVTGAQDVNSNFTSTATLVVLSVPTGVQVWAQIASFYGATYALLSSPDQGDEVVTGAVWTDQSATGPGTPCFVRTNTQGQVRVKRDAVAGANISFRTIGWRDARGRDS
jgi:hypothetical protein